MVPEMVLFLQELLVGLRRPTWIVGVVGIHQIHTDQPQVDRAVVGGQFVDHVLERIVVDEQLHLTGTVEDEVRIAYILGELDDSIDQPAVVALENLHRVQQGTVRSELKVLHRVVHGDQVADVDARLVR